MSITRSCSRTAAATLSITTVLVLTAGCGGSSKPTPSVPPVATSVVVTPTAMTTTTAAPPSPDPTAQADTQALDVYKNVVTASTAEMTTNKLGSDLSKYATGNAFMLFRQTVTFDINSNLIFVGTPQSAPKVSATDLVATPKTVTITDCFGGPNFLPVFATNDQVGHKKGQSAVGPGTSTAAHLRTVTVVNRTGAWLVEEYTLNAGAAC